MEFRIKEEMKSRGIKTQKELAERVGMSPSVFSRLLNGDLKSFNIDMLDKIAEALGCEVADLIAKKTPAQQIVCPHCGKPFYVSIQKP